MFVERAMLDFPIVPEERGAREWTRDKARIKQQVQWLSTEDQLSRDLVARKFRNQMLALEVSTGMLQVLLQVHGGQLALSQLLSALWGPQNWHPPGPPSAVALPRSHTSRASLSAAPAQPGPSLGSVKAVCTHHSQ